MTDEPQKRSFEEYVAARGHALLRFGYVLTGDKHMSEDLVQEALARTHQKWTKINSLDHPDAYVRRIIVNEFMSWGRRHGKRLTLVPDIPEQAHGAPRSDHVAASVDRSAMWELLAQLPRQQRAVLVLRFYEDCSDAQIAEILGCAPVTVRSHASKGLATLRAASTTSSILNGAE